MDKTKKSDAIMTDDLLKVYDLIGEIEKMEMVEGVMAIEFEQSKW